MNLRLIFSDCEIASVEAQPATTRTRIRLAAARVQQTGRDGERVEGFARGVLLVLHGASLSGPAGDLIGRVAQGRINVDGVWVASIPLPATLQGPIALDLSLANRSELVLAASRIDCSFEAGSNFSESLFC